MPAPENLIAYLRDHQYNPRSNKHGNALCRFVLQDLLSFCPKISEHAAEGRLVYCLNREIVVGTSNWNIDLVLGPPPSGFDLSKSAELIANTPPATIRIAIEAKTIMTEHGKARRNRLRDLDSYHQFVHRYDPNAVTAAVTVINMAPRFKSPLRSDVTPHPNITRLVDETVSLLRTLPVAGQAGGLEANTVIIVAHDNIDPEQTRLVTASPAPAIGDPLNYESFLRRICDRYTQRWS